MITDFLLDILFWIIRMLVALLPDIELPGWVQDISSMGAEVFETANSMGVWFPWALILTVVTAVLAAAGIGFGIKVVRMVISHVTGGGGSAA